jgi:hypothetical protein
LSVARGSPFEVAHAAIHGSFVGDGLADRLCAGSQIPILGGDDFVGERDDVEHLLIEDKHARGPRRPPFALTGAVVRLTQRDRLTANCRVARLRAREADTRRP